MNARRLLTLPEAAEELRCSRRTLERRIAAGELAVFRDGRRVAVPADVLRRYLAERTVMTSSSSGGAKRMAGRPLPQGRRLWD